MKFAFLRISLNRPEKRCLPPDSQYFPFASVFHIDRFTGIMFHFKADEWLSFLISRPQDMGKSSFVN
jgi:hypothetical protein